MSDPPGPAASSSLSDLLDDLERARFVGRTRELERLRTWILLDDGPRVVHLHGRPGIGASSLARAVARELRAAGTPVVHVAAEALDDLARAQDCWARVPDDAIVVVDRLPVVEGGALLRRSLEQCGRAGQRVLAVSRRPPDAGWMAGGWEAVTQTMELGRLDLAPAVELATRLGLQPQRATGVATWAAGVPAAVVAAVDVAMADEHAGRPETEPALDARVARAVLDRLAAELDAIDQQVVHVAALAGHVDEPLLTELAPDTNATDSVRALAATSLSDGDLTEPALDPLIAWAVATTRGERDPAGDREVRRQLADHFHERVTAGEPRWLPPMAALFRSPAFRRGFASDTRSILRPTALMGDDPEALREVAGANGAGWWPALERWVREAPGTVTVARDDDGLAVGWCVLFTPATAPPWAHEDPVVGPRLEHALRRYPQGDVVIWRDAFGTSTDLLPDPTAALVVAVHGAVQRSGHLHATCTYGSVVAGTASETVAQIYGTEIVPELTIHDGERTVSCHVLHHGFGGFAGGARALIYRDLGFPLPAPDLMSVREVVRAALRSYHDPVALASSPLARGETVEDRAAHVRDLIARAIEACSLSTGPSGRLSAIEHGYVRPGSNHDRAARALHLGRSTYFRHLGAEIERVAAWVADDLSAGDRGTPAGLSRD